MNSFKPTIGIYALCDPTTDRVMYVGKSIDLDYRFRTHSRTIHSHRTWGYWLAELKRAGLEPKMQTLEQCEETELDAAEKKWIYYFKARGQAELNVSLGGETRTASKVLNTHPDDWYQFASKVRDAYGLLLEVQGDSLELSSTPKNYESMRTLTLKWRLVIQKMEQELRQKFPEWKQVSSALLSAIEASDRASIHCGSKRYRANRDNCDANPHRSGAKLVGKRSDFT